MLVDSVGYLKKSSGAANADIRKAQIKPYVNHYLNDISGQSFAKNMDSKAVKQDSTSVVGKFLNLFA